MVQTPGMQLPCYLELTDLLGTQLNLCRHYFERAYVSINTMPGHSNSTWIDCTFTRQWLCYCLLPKTICYKVSTRVIYWLLVLMYLD